MNITFIIFLLIINSIFSFWLGLKSQKIRYDITFQEEVEDLRKEKEEFEKKKEYLLEIIPLLSKVQEKLEKKLRGSIYIETRNKETILEAKAELKNTMVYEFIGEVKRHIQRYLTVIK